MFSLVVGVLVTTGGRQVRTGVVFDERFRAHETGAGHPESPERYEAVIGGLAGAGLLEASVMMAPVAAGVEAIERCHDPLYVEMVREDVAAGRRQLSTGDTAIGARSLEVALLASGGVMVAVDAVMEGRAENAFCVVRPAGHHATRTRGMGFCIFNHVAVGARHAQWKYGVGRVMIIDWDVHHGNGTQDIFYEDGSVFYFSTHQSPWYPQTGKAHETGRGAGKGSTLNCPFRAGSGGREILGAFREKLLPAADRFRPELILISAGFDARAGDPLGRFLLTDEDFVELTGVVREMADVHAGGRIISVLEGGYDLEGLALASAAHVGALMGE